MAVSIYYIAVCNLFVIRVGTPEFVIDSLHLVNFCPLWIFS